MTAVAVLLFQVAACLGAGAVVLRALGIDRELGALERFAFAFVVGMGVLGWLMFPLGIAGLLEQAWLIGTLAVAAIGCVLLRSRALADGPDEEAPDAVTWAIAAALVAVLTLDFIEAMAPPTDADTLAYHFTTPKHFLEAGRIVFIPRPVDGGRAHRQSRNKGKYAAPTRDSTDPRSQRPDAPHKLLLTGGTAMKDGRPAVPILCCLEELRSSLLKNNVLLVAEQESPTA